MPFLVLFIVYVAAPKIDLFKIGLGGVRAEDFVWLGALALYTYEAGWRQRVQSKAYIKIFATFVLFALASTIVNLKSVGADSLLFIFRQIEYFSWAAIGTHASKSVTRRHLISGFTILALLLIPWGALELLGLIPKIGKFTGASDRLSLNTSGPFETSVVLAIVGYVSQGLYTKLPLGILLLATQARITIVSTVVAFSISRPRLALGALIGLPVFLLAAPMFQGAVTGSRFAEIPSISATASNAASMWDAAPVVSNAKEYAYAAGYGANGSDLLARYLSRSQSDYSLQIRFLRWSIIVKSVFANPLRAVIGMGAGCFGVAVDSNFVRTLGEFGITGTIIFLLFIRALWMQSGPGSISRFITVVMFGTAIFIDIFWSTKAMPILWFITSLEGCWSMRRLGPVGTTS